MSLKRRSAALLALVVLVAMAATLGGALAQGAPFGAPRPPASAAPTGFIGWVLTEQAAFYRKLTAAVRAAREGGGAIVPLVTIGFLYGVFHAAGPGHGKAVISSYILANEETLKRGVIVSFASALMQALTAFLLVGVLSLVIGGTAATMSRTLNIVETASYAAIVAIGLRLVWSKGRGLLRALAPAPVAATPAGPLVAAPHECDADCGHLHAPDPAMLSRSSWWREAVPLILSVGARPCSGAVLVLVFALAQGVALAGAASVLAMSLGTALTVSGIAALAVFAKRTALRVARPGTRGGLVAIRAIETGAAVLVLLFGVFLLSGYLVSERFGPFG